MDQIQISCSAEPQDFEQARERLIALVQTPKTKFYAWKVLNKLEQSMTYAFDEELHKFKKSLETPHVIVLKVCAEIARESGKKGM